MGMESGRRQRLSNCGGFESETLKPLNSLETFMKHAFSLSATLILGAARACTWTN